MVLSILRTMFASDTPLRYVQGIKSAAAPTEANGFGLARYRQNKG
jgi:hypothetical protein